MTELKTLKDLYKKINLKTASGKNRLPSIVLVEYEQELKAEAVKWVKSRREQLNYRRNK